MATSRVRSAPVVNRTCRYFPGCDPAGPSLVEIEETKGKKTECKRYWLSEFACDGGRGFKWETFEQDCRDGEDGVYNVFISDDPTATPNSCECKGHLNWGHRTICRHIACTLSLMERDRI